MPTFPIQIDRTYVNPGGNLSASGYYRSHITQQTTNMMPPWMHMRENPRSRGQQFLSPMAMELNKLEDVMNDQFKSKFLTTAPVDEIDVLYKMKLPSNVDLTDASASGIRCIAAPSGSSPSGVNSIWLNEVDDLEAFYYHVLPTRIEVIASGNYTASIGTISWHAAPSGVLDLHQKYVDRWKTEHDLTWAYSTPYFRKQDRETMEDYDIYTPTNGYGTPTDLYFYDDILWWIGVDGSDYYLNMSNPKTQIPQETSLDLLASFDISDAVSSVPSRIIIDEEGTIWIADVGEDWIYKMKPRYDYYIFDKQNRFIYLREDYRNSGVLISNT